MTGTGNLSPYEVGRSRLRGLNLGGEEIDTCTPVGSRLFTMWPRDPTCDRRP